MVFSFFLVLNSLHRLWVSMVLKSIPIHTVLISSFQPHKALDEYKDCNFQCYSVVRIRIYLSNHNAEKFLLIDRFITYINTVSFRPFQEHYKSVGNLILLKFLRSQRGILVE